MIVSTKGNRDKYTNLIVNIIKLKHKDLIVNQDRLIGCDYIPLPKDIIKKIDLLLKFQSESVHGFEDKRIDFIVDDLLLAYEPLIQRSNEAKNKIILANEKNEKYLNDKIIPELKKINSICKKFKSDMSQIDLDIFDESKLNGSMSVLIQRITITSKINQIDNLLRLSETICKNNLK